MLLVHNENITLSHNTKVVIWSLLPFKCTINFSFSVLCSVIYFVKLWWIHIDVIHVFLLLFSMWYVSKLTYGQPTPLCPLKIKEEIKKDMKRFNKILHLHNNNVSIFYFTQTTSQNEKDCCFISENIKFDFETRGKEIF